MSIARHHNEWLSLVPNSGPFLSLPVLVQAFPQGLDVHDSDHARRLRMAVDEWDDNQLGRRPDPAIHRAWIKFVLDETLGYEDLLAEGQAIPQTLKSEVAEYGEMLRPDFVVNDPATKKARLLVQMYPRSQSLSKPVASSRWKTSPDTRMMQLLHDTGIRLGIVTNGDHWMLVNAPKNETTGYASWYANLWLEEKDTLRAFRTLLSEDRFFSVRETLEALLDKSAADQQEVTVQLGYQVRKAVEVLIQALDKADQDHGRKLLAEVDEKVLYESALTVMMRLVFLFCAEEQELLLLSDDLYDKNYAVSTLREQLSVTADQYGEEILGLRYDAWTRLLTSFRAVYAGVKHDRLKLRAYGGSLFNPDRFPFLEGRKIGTSWKNTEATPLPVSNRTVLHLLEALQVLQVRLPGGGAAEARKLSFRSLGIEQIGHVYEGLLDHTAKRAVEPVLGLQGTRDKEPEIALADLEKIAAKGEKELLKFLKDETGRSESAIKKGLYVEIDDQLLSRFRTACQDSDLWRRVKPFAGLVRQDTSGYPVVITAGSAFVTSGTDRRSSGTHYTPKSLTEPIVQYTLEPLVFVGPAEGLPKNQWKLRSAKELLALKICDMACGSGAFLVQVCRYLAARLLEAWDAAQYATPGTKRITPEGEPSTGQFGEMLIPDDPNERQTYALRIVAQRSLYGVDKNPLAVEMAKLSLWLLTLAKDKPFEFLDHAIRCGDSLVGIHNLDQLRNFDLRPNAPDTFDFPGEFDESVNDAMHLRSRIADMEGNTVEIVEAQDRMLRESNEKIDRLKCAADMLIGAEFLRWDQHILIRDKLKDDELADSDDEQWQPSSWRKAKKETAQFRRAARTRARINVLEHFQGQRLDTFRDECSLWLNGQMPFHWPLEFPEVMVERSGFDAFVGNPPFMGGQIITNSYGSEYRHFLIAAIAAGKRGSADYCAYFLLRAAALLKSEGSAGFISTNTISEGETRNVGLEQLSSFTTLRSAWSSIPWPGSASLAVSILWLVKAKWHGRRYLDGRQVEGISDALSDVGVERGTPKRLSRNRDFAAKGSSLQGVGFLLSLKDASLLLEQHPDESPVLFPYLGGNDITSEFDGRPTRWAINFFDYSLDEARRFPTCLRIVQERVKPEREKAAARNTIGARRSQYWWRYDAQARDLYHRLSYLVEAWACAETSKYLCIMRVPATIVFSHSVIVFPTDSFSFFSVIASTFHFLWVDEYSHTLETRLRYSVAEAYDTFPLPSLTVDRLPDTLSQYGHSLFSYRTKVMTDEHEGLTKTYNRFHAPDEFSTHIQNLRHLHVEMDNAVASAYGWTDLDLGHGFHETKQGVRYTINELARREVLARLLKLNQERYTEEESQGLHEKKATASKRKKVEIADTGGSLFGKDN